MRSRLIHSGRERRLFHTDLRGCKYGLVTLTNLGETTSGSSSYEAWTTALYCTVQSNKPVWQQGFLVTGWPKARRVVEGMATAGYSHDTSGNPEFRWAGPWKVSK